MFRKLASLHIVIRILFLLMLAAAVAAGVWKFTVGQSVPVEKAVVSYGPMTDLYTEEGTVSFGDRYQIVSEVSGSIREICVSENSLVNAGDLLYRVDDRVYVFQKEQSENALAGYQAKMSQSRFGQLMTSSPTEYLAGLSRELAAAGAALQAADTTWSGAQSLYAGGDIARVEYEKIRAEYQSAQATYEQAKARYDESNSYLEELKARGISEEELNALFYASEDKQLEALIAEQESNIRHLEDEIAKCTVRAEMDGKVVGLPLKELSGVQQGQITVILQNMTEPGAQADVLTSIAPWLREGSQVEGRISLRGKDEIYSFEIDRIYDYAEKGVSSLGLDEYRVHVRLKLREDPSDPDRTKAQAEALLARENYGIELDFTLFEEEHVLTVPSGAVFTSEDQDYIYLIEDGRAVRKRIESRYRSASTVVLDEDKSEVKAGDIVIDRVDSRGIHEGVTVR